MIANMDFLNRSENLGGKKCFHVKSLVVPCQWSVVALLFGLIE